MTKSKFITLAVSLALVALALGCTVSTEGSPGASTTSALTQDAAMAACEAAPAAPGSSATNGNGCGAVADCRGNALIGTYGGSSYQGVPLHPDELDGWVYSGPLAGDTVKAVTGAGKYAAYACAVPGSGGYPGAPLVVTGSW